MKSMDAVEVEIVFDGVRNGTIEKKTKDMLEQRLASLFTVLKENVQNARLFLTRSVKDFQTVLEAEQARSARGEADVANEADEAGAVRDSPPDPTAQGPGRGHGDLPLPMTAPRPLLHESFNTQPATTRPLNRRAARSLLLP